MDKKVVVMGGGTGSFAVLSGLKKLDNVELTAIVPSTDSGGSSGRLRDEFGYLPVGDLRQCLVALASDSRQQYWLRKLFNYRFSKGGGLNGHNFGNLFLTALQDMMSDDLRSIEIMSELLNIQGKVLPITLNKCDLVAEYENGKVLKGEKAIDEPEHPHDGNLTIKHLYVEPQVETHKAVEQALAEADLIILGPGDLYTSLLANVVINDVATKIQHSKAKLVHIANLVTKFGHTTNFTLSDHVQELETYMGRALDHILFNSTVLPKDILQKYRLENAEPVVDDTFKDDRVVRTDLLASEEIKAESGDNVRRSLIRHDSDKVAQAIQRLL